MKRINLSVDIEDNDVLGESIKNAIAAQAKQIARQELEKELVSEMERIVTAKVNEIKSSSYWNSITSRLTDLVVQKLDKEIRLNTEEINSMVEDKVSTFLDQKLNSAKGLDGFIQSYVDQSLSKILARKL
ncbi:hypothetical protein [Cytobacillus gottheilii]|uniref:hypothetical protein n=1 Tax=Cytobacillus gottheilii TaxID=859144 RepID=UPI0009B96F4F|nr:hypothetical protein [Cytobacillus gottheilii]